MLLKKSRILGSKTRFTRLKKDGIMRCYRCSFWDGKLLRENCPVGLCNIFNNPFGSDHSLGFIYIIRNKKEET